MSLAGLEDPARVVPGDRERLRLAGGRRGGRRALGEDAVAGAALRHAARAGQLRAGRRRRARGLDAARAGRAAQGARHEPDGASPLRRARAGRWRRSRCRIRRGCPPLDELGRLAGGRALRRARRGDRCRASRSRGQRRGGGRGVRAARRAAARDRAGRGAREAALAGGARRAARAEPRLPDRAARPARPPADAAGHDRLDPRAALAPRAGALPAPVRVRAAAARSRRPRRSRTRARTSASTCSRRCRRWWTRACLRCRDATAEDPRFEMLEIVREYALERLAKSGDVAATRRAHAAYSLVLAEDGAQAISGAGRGRDAGCASTRSGRTCGRSLDHLMEDRNAGVGHAARDGAPARTGAAGSGWPRGASGSPRCWRFEGASARARAGALYAASLMSGEQGDGARTRPLARGERRAVPRPRRRPRGAGGAERARGGVPAGGGPAGGSSHLEAGAAGARGGWTTPTPWRARLNNLASVAHAGGNHGRGGAASTASAGSCSRREGIASGPPGCSTRRVTPRRDGGDPEAARSLYESSLAIFRELDDRGGMATTLTDLARLARREGDLDDGAAALPGGAGARGDRLSPRGGAAARGARGARRRRPGGASRARATSRRPPRSGCGWAGRCPPRSGGGASSSSRSRRTRSERAALRAWSEGWRMGEAEALRLARATG